MANSDTNFDFVVAGNGIIGMSIAAKLSDVLPDSKIAIVGPRLPEASASLAAGAMLGCFGEVTRHGLQTIAGRAKLTLDIAAAQLWPAWVDTINERLGTPQVSIRPGTFVILNTRSARLDDLNYQAIEQALRERGEVFEEVSPSHIPGMHPVDDSRALRALYIPGEGSIPSASMIAALRKVLEATPAVKLLDDFVEAPVLERSRVTGVRLRSGKLLHTNTLVVAAGTAAQDLIDKAFGGANPIPRLFSGTGSSLIIDAPGSEIGTVIRTPNRSFACGLHVLPAPDGKVYVGATNNINPRAQTLPTLSDVYFLLECVLDQVDHRLQGAQITALQTGTRPVTVDTYPLLGRTSIDGFWLMTGTYRDGFHLSPLLADFLVRSLQNDTVATEFEMFCPERAPIQPESRDAAIRQAALYYSAVGFEHGIKIPKVGWEEMIDEMLVDKVRSLYDELDTEYTLHPDLVSLVDRDRAGMIPILRRCLSGPRGSYSSV